MIRCTDKLCLDGDPIDDLPAPRWALASTMLCRRCAAALEQRLAETAAMVDLLRAHLGGHTTTRGDGRGSTAWPIPLNVNAHDLLQHYPAVLSSWVRMVCEERSLRGPDRPDPAVLSGWLLSQLDWLVEQPWVDDLADEIRDLSNTAHGITAVRHRRYRLEPACPSCDARELGRWDGSDQVDCASCGRSWPHERYPALIRLALDDSRGSLTASEAAQRLGVSASRVSQLVAAGRIKKLGTVDGTARYSTADVEAHKAQEGAA